MMKKTIAVLMAAVLLLSFVACGGGLSKESLIGTWEVTEAKVDGGEMLVGSTMTFDENDHYAWTAMGFTLLEGTYKVSGSFVYLDGEKEIFKLNGDTLTIKDASGEMTLIRK